MASSLPSQSTKSSLNPLHSSRNPLAKEVDDFLSGFDHLDNQNLASPTLLGNDALRAKMDAITSRVRHPSLPVATLPDDLASQEEITSAQPLRTELPVKQRLDSFEVMRKEIRDSMTLQRQPQPLAALGQVQPRRGPFGLPPPAKDRRSRDDHRPSHRSPAPPQLDGRQRSQYSDYDTDRPRPAFAMPHQARRRDHHQVPMRPKRRRRSRNTTPPPPASRRRYPAPRRDRTPSPASSSSSSGTASEHDSDRGKRRATSKEPTLIDQALARQYQHMGRPTGRSCDILPPTVRPHDALPPPPRYEKSSQGQDRQKEPQGSNPPRVRVWLHAHAAHRD